MIPNEELDTLRTSDLAEKYGISASYVSRLKKRRGIELRTKDAKLAKRIEYLSRKLRVAPELIEEKCHICKRPTGAVDSLTNKFLCIDCMTIVRASGRSNLLLMQIMNYIRSSDL